MSIHLGVAQTGFDLIATKYYIAGVGALYFYDYFLTLADEIEYAWRGKKTWLFYLFILNRYIPMVYVGWASGAVLSLTYPKSVWLCEKTAIFEFVFFFWTTFVAQVFLIVRVYALTSRNRIVAGLFTTFTTVQIILGVFFMISTGATSLPLPDIKLEPFHICLFAPNSKLERICKICMSSPLVFDSCTFIAIVVSAYKSLPPASAKNLIFAGFVGRIVKDATIYFGLIFSAQFIVTMFCFLTLQGWGLVAGAGNSLILPMMVSRLCLSLKKSADPRSMVEWRVDHFSRFEITNVSKLCFATQPVGKSAVETQAPC